MSLGRQVAGAGPGANDIISRKRVVGAGRRKFTETSANGCLLEQLKENDKRRQHVYNAVQPFSALPHRPRLVRMARLQSGAACRAFPGDRLGLLSWHR